MIRKFGYVEPSGGDATSPPPCSRGDDGDSKGVITGKPVSYGICVNAINFGMCHRSVGDWLASDGVFEIAITGKPVSDGICVNAINFGMYHRPVGDWLASDGVFGIAITGKPVSYRSALKPSISACTTDP